MIYPDINAIRETYGSDVTVAQIENALDRVLAEANGALPAYKRIETFLIRNNEFSKTSTKKIRRTGLAERNFAAFQNRK